MKKLELNWVKVLNGEIAISHKPSKKLIPELKKSGVTHILTLLSEKEEARIIGDLVTLNGMEWLWFPMENANIPEDSRLNELLVLFSRIKILLENNAKIFIHCSAGINRTGMITYSLLRYLGYKKDNALDKLKSMRDITFRDVGEKRLQWGDKFGVI